MHKNTYIRGGAKDKFISRAAAIGMYMQQIRDTKLNKKGIQTHTAESTDTSKDGVCKPPVDLNTVFRRVMLMRIHISSTGGDVPLSHDI